MFILLIVLYHRAVIHHADHCFDKLNVDEIELHLAIDFNKICLFYKLTYWVWFCGNRKLTAEKATLYANLHESPSHVLSTEPYED